MKIELLAIGSCVCYGLAIIIYWSHEDQVFLAEVPELPGCMAHGKTQELALTYAKEAIELWIDTAKEFGDPIPYPQTSLVYA